MQIYNTDSTTVKGTDSSDIIISDAPEVLVEGYGGNDQITNVANGTFTACGGAGNDIIINYAESGDTSLDGQWGDDFIISYVTQSLDVHLIGGDGNDTLMNCGNGMATLDAGGSIVTSEKFSPRRWLELVRDATAIYLVPTKLILLATGEPLENIRAIFTGSQVLSAAQSLSLLKKFPAAELILYYGATELNYITYKKISAENAGDVQNLGRAFDGVKIFVRDGLIYVDTKFHVSGFDNPGTVGDAGFIDGHGDLIFLGRGEDFINRGGVKVFASAVEQKLLTVGGVTAAAVVKVPDETRGENFLAFVVGDVDKKTIRQALTPAELPREIIFVDALPLNSSGKVDKKRLLEQLN